MAAVGYLTPGGGEGIPGPKGDQGDPGPQGPPGDTGPAGPKGDTGPAGADGAQGPKGDTGSQGPKGDTGSQGPKGDTGSQGPKGDTGDTGPAGADGAQGPKGDTGAQGIQGVKGDTGSQGPAGPAGAVFPLEEGYGFHSASILPELCRVSTSPAGAWQCLVWVPAGKAITKAGTIVITAGGGTPTFVGFAVYTADGLTKLGDTGHVATLFTSTGLRSAPLTASVVAQGAGRFVRVVMTQNHSPEPAFAIQTGNGGGPELNAGPQGRRTAPMAALSSFPSTITPGGTAAGTSMFLMLLG